MVILMKLGFSHVILGLNVIEKYGKCQVTWYEEQESPSLEEVKVEDGSSKRRPLTQEIRV